MFCPNFLLSSVFLPLSFAPPLFIPKKPSRVISPFRPSCPPPLTYMAALSVFTPVSRNTSQAVTPCTNPNPNLAHLALGAAFHQRAEGVVPAAPSSTWLRRSRVETFARLGRGASASDAVVSAHQPFGFAHSLLARGTERHEDVRVYLGCLNLCAPSTLTSLLV